MRATAMVVGLLLWCPGARADDIVHKQTVLVAGAPRTYYVYIPPSISAAAPPPLLVALHGSRGNGRDLIRNWTELADREGLIVVAPNATTPVGWKIRGDGPDYLRSVVDATAAICAIDRRRVYLFGYSAGAVHALTVGLIESEYFAAVAIYAGAWLDARSYTALQFAARKIPVAMVVGDRDEFFPMESVLATKSALEGAGHRVLLAILPVQGHVYERVSAKVNASLWEFLKPVELPDVPKYREYR